jgi:hypothetical protein
MDTITRQLAVELQMLVETYEAAMEVDTGDEIADEAYRHGVESVLGDIKSLLNDVTTDSFNSLHPDKPFIPIGFKLHAVIH